MGRVKTAERVEGSDKLLKLTVDFGGEIRTIAAGIAEHYSPEEMAQKTLPFVTNIEPRVLRGVESQGMLLACARDGETPVLLSPEKDVPPGTIII